MSKYPIIFLDGDFETGTECKHHCSPSCHPAQVGPEWVYGCTHEIWPQNRAGDFVPIVDCDGDPKKCELPPKMLRRAIVGQRRRCDNAVKKAKVARAAISELRKLLED